MAAWRATVSSRSSRNRPAPRRRRSSSLRFTLTPTQGSLSRATSHRLPQVSLDGLDNVLVARAPAEVASQLRPEALSLEDDAAVGQGHGAQEELRRAVAALEAVGVAERLLYGVELAPPPQALHGGERAAVGLG